MSKFKGTPGPWRWVGGWLEGGVRDDVLAYAGCGSHMPEVSDEDARLIAAAPLLLEAALEATRGNHYDDCTCKLCAAIAAALGQHGEATD